jgi:hypothetical protein
MNRVAALFICALLTVGAAAQEGTPREKVRGFSFTQEERVPFPPPGFNPGLNFFYQSGDPTHGAQVALHMTEMAGGGEVVTNAPYTANAVEETTQVLGDGNRIVNKSSDFIARDSQGRTRRETTLNRIGPVTVNGAKVIFLNDPTTHTQYVLQNGDATKILRSEATWTSGPTIVMADRNGRALKEKIIAAHQVGERHAGGGEEEQQVKHEDLGSQTIEGVSAEGKRDTMTIPAGQIGNERPIEVVSETWYSPELRTMVLRKHSDPRVGETVFRLTDIRRGEPDAALFQPPPGAKTRVEPLIELHQKMMAPPKE